ncbi:MAG: hypothetical protein GY846_25740 [Deltaproteobacteria bacterium]|nr:hypothetical protein [Deltaproteobacteria bacterium]
MKKVLIAISAAVLVIYPCVCFSSYLIHLKDGRKFLTDRYQDEGGQIKFKRHGGVIGVQKDLVKEIEEIKDFPENEGNEDETRATREKEAPGKRTEPDIEARSKEVERVNPEAPSVKAALHSEEKESGSEKEPAEKDDSKEKPGDEQLYQNQRIALSLKVRAALESYKRAKKVGDRESIDEEFRKVSQISSELEDLEKEVKAKNGGILPSWWWEEDENGG